mgnify:CR=1 FL=1
MALASSLPAHPGSGIAVDENGVVVHINDTWLRWLGQHSIVIYLAFMVPLALTRNGLPALLRHGDWNSMRWSIESRVPFLSPSIAEFTLGLPEHWRRGPDAGRIGRSRGRARRRRARAVRAARRVPSLAAAVAIYGLIGSPEAIAAQAQTYSELLPQGTDRARHHQWRAETIDERGTFSADTVERAWANDAGFAALTLTSISLIRIYFEPEWTHLGTAAPTAR